MTQEKPRSSRGRRIAIVQSSYIPWKGYFDLINAVDEFVLLDDVQYTRRDWRNRNQIKTERGLRWLSIPVQSRGRYHQRIDQTRVADRGWARSHWSAIEQSYRRAPHFEWVAAVFEPLYRDLGAEDLLSTINHALLREACVLLEIDTTISWATDYEADSVRNAHLLSICLAAGATEYLSGPSAQSYLDTAMFERAGVTVSWFDYGGYRPYPQLHGPFEHHVSIVDLLCCEGPRSAAFLKTTGSRLPLDLAAR